MPVLAAKKPAEEKETSAGPPDLGWKTVLFNCDCHTFDEVERQLIKATRCSLSAARALSWEVHTRGSAVVFTGPKERCEAVAAVLEDIRLKVRVTD